MPASCTRSWATHSALPQVRPEPRRGLPHRQAGRTRASQAPYASSSAMPPEPGTETTGRIPPPGNASHSLGLPAAGSSGTPPTMTTILLLFSSVPDARKLLARTGPTGPARPAASRSGPRALLASSLAAPAVHHARRRQGVPPPGSGAVPAAGPGSRQLLNVGVRVGRGGQACGDRLVDRPGLSLGHAAVECHRVAGGTGGGQLGGKVIRHADAEQGVGRREQRLARAEQLASAVRLPAAGRDLAQPGERERHASRTAKLLPGPQRIGKQRPGRR